MIAERERVVVDHWYLCRRAARRFIRRGLDRADLEQVAAIGLLKAVDRYDATQKAPFEAYAWLLIMGELMHHVRDSERLVRAPRNVRSWERRWSRAERELWVTLGREPQERDVADLAGMAPHQIREIRAFRASSRVVSFDLLYTAESQLPPASIEHVLDRLTVDAMLAGLEPLERRIIEAIHLDGATVVELAARLGYSRRHLTRLHRNAMDRLRQRLGSGVAAARLAEERSADVSLSHCR